MKKYQIFVSSTYRDLADERKAVIEKISELGQFPVGMEYFPSSDTSQWEYIETELKNSDYMVLILAERNGSCDENDEKQRSFVQKEYEKAMELGIPVLAFFKRGISVSDNKALVNFHDEILKGKGNGRLVAYWSDSEELCNEVVKALFHAVIDRPQKGWRHTESNLYMTSRKELQSRFTIGERLGMQDGRYEKIRKIKIMNLAGNLMVNQEMADYGHLSDMGEMKLADAMQKILEETKAIVHLILAEPNEHNLYDIPFKIFNSRPSKPEMCLTEALTAMREILTNGSVYQRAWERAKGVESQFDFHVAKFVIPYAIFNVEFIDAYSDYNHVKVDLYCPALGDEDERRSFIIYQKEEPENYRFFVDNFDRIARDEKLCKLVTMDDLAQW